MIFSVLFLTVLARVHASWSDSTCSEEMVVCNNLYEDNDNGDCDDFLRTIECYQDILDNCVSGAFQADRSKRITIEEYYCHMDYACTPDLTFSECVELVDEQETPSPPPSSPPISTCPYNPPLSSIFTYPVIDLGSPSLSYSPPTPECTLPPFQTLHKQHCSIFSLSHLRPFSDRQQNTGLQTCTLLGHIYLLKHSALSVTVNAAAQSGTIGIYTHITEVNVTFHQYQSCFPQQVHYTATADQLPYPEPCQTQNGLNITVNDTVATLIAPWINTTIIIRRNDGHLSVSLQVPLPLSRSGQVTGLCDQGCPSSFEVSTNFSEYQCGLNKQSVSIKCLMLGLPLHDIDRTTYTQLCVYDILKTHNLNFLSLYSALKQDYYLLPDAIDMTEPPSETTPPTASTSSSSSSSSSPDATTIVIATSSPHSEGVVGSASVTASPLLSLILFLFFFSLFLR